MDMCIAVSLKCITVCTCDVIIVMYGFCIGSFGGGKFLPVFVIGTYCTGKENRLIQCSNVSTGVASCDYMQNVAITCTRKTICEVD